MTKRKYKNKESFVKSDYYLRFFLFFKRSKYFSFTNNILIGLGNDYFSKHSWQVLIPFYFKARIFHKAYVKELMYVLSL